MTTPVYYTGELSVPQNLYTITSPSRNTNPLVITTISKANPAVVTTAAPISSSLNGTRIRIGNIFSSLAFVQASSVGTFVAGETIMQATSGATAYVYSVLAGGRVSTSPPSTLYPGILVIQYISGTFDTTHTVTGATSGATMTPSAVTAGMTELATAGIDGGRDYYAYVLSPTTFALYLDPDFGTSVDSTTFGTPVTGGQSYTTYTVDQYNTVPSPVTVAFDYSIAGGGNQISLDQYTGVITLDAGSDYQLTAVANTTRPLPATSLAGVQWYDLTNDVALSEVVPFGQTCTATVSAGVETQVVLSAYSDGTTFEYPNQLYNANFNVQLIVPV